MHRWKHAGSNRPFTMNSSSENRFHSSIRSAGICDEHEEKLIPLQTTKGWKHA